MTPEQIAIRQHLSKERPWPHGCACMGRRPRRTSDRNSPGPSYPGDTEYEVIVPDLGEDKLKTVQELRRVFAIPLSAVKSILAAGSWSLKTREYVGHDVKKLKKAGIKCELREDSPELEPYCACAMAWVEVVDSHYYRIDEHRSPDGVTHTAKHIGHIAGPYMLDDEQ